METIFSHMDMENVGKQLCFFSTDNHLHMMGVSMYLYKWAAVEEILLGILINSSPKRQGTYPHY